jgi:hypothetical protein
MPSPTDALADVPTDAPTRAPVSTTCYDLKVTYRNSSCCSQSTGKTAIFDGAVVTCGSLRSSYKSSDCCSADLLKNATMTYDWITYI